MAGKVKIGVIGIGAIGSLHVDALKKVPHAEVAAICDGQPERLEAKGKQYGVSRLFADHREMLKEDLDAVIVATPNATHCPQTLDALKAGKNVLCEKPMALSAREAQKMVQAAKAAGKFIQIGMVQRLRGEAQVLKECITNGDLGRIYHTRVVLCRRRGVPGLGGWFTTKSMAGGGCLIDIGVHFFDLAMWLADTWKPQRVSASTHAEFGPRMKGYTFTRMWAGPPRYEGVCDVEDYAAGFVRFQKDCTLSFQISWAANVAQENFVEVIGTKGGVRTGQSKESMMLLTEHGGRIADIATQYVETDHFLLQAQNFVGAVQGKNPPQATGEQGLAVMKLLDAIYRSARQGREVTVGTAD